MKKTMIRFIDFVRGLRLSLAIGGLAAWIGVMVMHSCTRTVYTGTGQDSTYLGRLQFVLQDNSTFSIFYATLQASDYLDTISGPGPYTVLASNVDGYAGYTPSFVPSNATTVTTAIGGPTVLPVYTGYALLGGQHSFRSLPLQANQEFATLNGQQVYVTRYLSGSDTLTTVNGQQVISLDEPATNGLIDVVQGVCNPQRYPTVLQQIESDSNYAYFDAALQRTHLDSLLAGSGTYTVLVPTNQAFRSLPVSGIDPGVNITSIDSIRTADPVKLAKIIGYHILPGRYFQNDFWRMLTTDSLPLTMYNGEIVQFAASANSLGYFPSRTPGPGFFGRGNSQSTDPYFQLAGVYTLEFCSGNYCYNINYGDWPAGNGVVQCITAVLIP